VRLSLISIFLIQLAIHTVTNMSLGIGVSKTPNPAVNRTLRKKPRKAGYLERYVSGDLSCKSS